MANSTMQTASTIFFLLLQFIFFQVSSAGDYCYGTYCTYGCCGTWRNECCHNSVAIIIGSCVGAAVFIFILIIVCCVCRRRRYNGTVYRQGGPMVIQASTVTTSNGMVTTSGVQPGYAYPPQPVAPYGQTLLPYGQPAPYPYSAPPPSYNDVAAAPSAVPQPGGGNVNPGFEPK